MGESEVMVAYFMFLLVVGGLGIVVVAGIPQAAIAGAIVVLEQRGKTKRILAEARLQEAKNAARSTSPGASDV